MHHKLKLEKLNIQAFLTLCSTRDIDFLRQHLHGKQLRQVLRTRSLAGFSYARILARNAGRLRMLLEESSLPEAERNRLQEQVLTVRLAAINFQFKFIAQLICPAATVDVSSTLRSYQQVMQRLTIMPTVLLVSHA